MFVAWYNSLCFHLQLRVYERVLSVDDIKRLMKLPLA